MRPARPVSGPDGAVRRKALHLAAFLVIIGLANFFLLYRAEWSVIFWGTDRPRLPAIWFTMLALGAFAVCQRGIAPRRTEDWTGPGLIVALSWLVGLSLTTAFGVIEQFANSGDEYAYWFGAQTYLTGHLWNAAPPLGQVMASNYTWVAGAKWAGQYPPGWPGLIAGMSAIGISPWIIGTLLAAATLFGLHRLVERDAGRGPATLAALLFAVAPFTIFNAASLHSHILAAALAVAALVAIMQPVGTRSLKRALLTGALIGMLGITRSVTAAMVVLPIIGMLAIRRDVRSIIALGLGGVPFVLLLLWYQGSITGDPLKPVYWLGGRNVDHLYFDLPSIRIGFVQTVNRLAGLSLWTAPVLPILWLVAFGAKLRLRKLTPADFVFPLGVLIFVFYPLHQGNGYGPRYYFDFWPLMLYTIGTALPLLRSELRRTGEALILLSLLYGVAAWPVLAGDFRRITDERRDLYDQVAARGLQKAVICIRTSTSPTLPMPVSDLSRNGVNMGGAVLYARCETMDPRLLQRAFPGRSLWIYEREATAVRGRLHPIR